MLKNVTQLYHIAQKPERRIVGLMSGTSLDGLDVALCRISGEGRSTQVTLEAFETHPYPDALKESIRNVFAREQIAFQELTLLHATIADTHAALVLDSLQKWAVAPGEVDLIASHGQTVFHAPRVLHGRSDAPNATLQIGDGDHIARRTGIITVSDFRQKHVAAGGEGAPLALYGDYLLFSQESIHRILLNIGGIANFTLLPAAGSTARVIATDTGPGNTLTDAFARELFEVPYDQNGRLATAGVPDQALLDALWEDPFFHAPYPHTTGPELFNAAWVRRAMERLPKGSPAVNPYNLMATLTAFTAETIATAVEQVAPGLHGEVWVSGGGANNPVIMNHLKEKMPRWTVGPLDDLGIPGDAKEAILFALLANECVAGTTGYDALRHYAPDVTMGKISFPD